MDAGDVLPKRRSVSREGTAALRGRPSSATILSMTWLRVLGVQGQLGSTGNLRSVLMFRLCIVGIGAERGPQLSHNHANNPEHGSTPARPERGQRSSRVSGFGLLFGGWVHRRS